MYPAYGADPDEAVRRAWVAIRPADEPQPVGAGVVIAEGYVLTCAHVVNAALGRDRMSAAEPTAEELAGVALVLPGVLPGARPGSAPPPGQAARPRAVGPRSYRPRLVCWSPPVPGDAAWWEGDLALLALPADAPRIAPVRLAPAPLGSIAWAWYADGDGRTTVDVIVQKPLGPWLMLDPGQAELAVKPGYSGGPLWHSETSTLAGVIVSVEPDVRRYYAIGPEAVQALLIRAGLRAAAPDRDARHARLHRRITDALDQLPPDRYDRGLARFLAALGAPPAACRPEDAAATALAHPRGLPALRDAFPECEALRTAVARACPVRLLAPADHAELRALLCRVPLPDLLAAARVAVAFLPLRADQVADTAAFIEHLEDRDFEPGMVPPLLEVVEEVAARREEVAEDLREWSTTVADRLHAQDGALRQVRTQARARACARAAACPVVRVWLWPHPRPDTYSYVIRLYDGDDNPLQTWATADTPRGRDTLCDELARAVDRLADQDETAGVEFLLEEGAFGLPYDRWRIPDAALGPRMLGIDRFVVLRGRRARKRGPWERRWRSLGGGASVVHDVDDADGVLGDNLDAAFVIAACPADQVDAMVGLCRYYGVPVVLWHRQTAGEEAARVLLELVGECSPRDLREEVRRSRLKARGDDHLVGAHLSLLWEDPRWDPAELPLTEPAAVAVAVSLAGPLAPMGDGSVPEPPPGSTSAPHPVPVPAAKGGAA